MPGGLSAGAEHHRPVRSARVTVMFDWPPLVPTAVQAAAAGHDTLKSSLSTVPAGTGVACSRQLVPFHASANPPGAAKSLVASTPTAVPARGEVHEAVFRTLRPPATGVGVAWTRQAEPL